MKSKFDRLRKDHHNFQLQQFELPNSEPGFTMLMSGDSSQMIIENKRAGNNAAIELILSKSARSNTSGEEKMEYIGVSVAHVAMKENEIKLLQYPDKKLKEQNVLQIEKDISNTTDGKIGLVAVSSEVQAKTLFSTQPNPVISFRAVHLQSDWSYLNSTGRYLQDIALFRIAANKFDRRFNTLDSKESLQKYPYIPPEKLSSSDNLVIGNVKGILSIWDSDVENLHRLFEMRGKAWWLNGPITIVVGGASGFIVDLDPETAEPVSPDNEDNKRSKRLRCAVEKR